MITRRYIVEVKCDRCGKVFARKDGGDDEIEKIRSEVVHQNHGLEILFQGKCSISYKDLCSSCIRAIEKIIEDVKSVDSKRGRKRTQNTMPCVKVIQIPGVNNEKDGKAETK